MEDLILTENFVKTFVATMIVACTVSIREKFWKIVTGSFTIQFLHMAEVPFNATSFQPQPPLSLFTVSPTSPDTTTVSQSG